MEQQAKERTFSWVDLLLISLFALIVFAGSLFLLYRFRREETEILKVEYTVLVPEVPMSMPMRSCWDMVLDSFRGRFI